MALTVICWPQGVFYRACVRGAKLASPVLAAGTFTECSGTLDDLGRFEMSQASTIHVATERFPCDCCTVSVFRQVRLEMPAGRYVVPIELLSKHPDETVDILRLGALANALNAVTGMSATSLSTGVGHDRDVLQTSLLVASYLKEAIDILDRQRLWALVDRAVAAGYKLPHEVEYYRHVFSRTKGSL